MIACRVWRVEVPGDTEWSPSRYEFRVVSADAPANWWEGHYVSAVPLSGPELVTGESRRYAGYPQTSIAAINRALSNQS